MHPARKGVNKRAQLSNRKTRPIMFAETGACHILASSRTNLSQMVRPGHASFNVFVNWYKGLFLDSSPDNIDHNQP